MNCHRLSTDYTFPHGDSIDVFWSPGPGGIVVSDLGETLRWIEAATGQDVAEYRDAINRICIRHGVDFRDGRIESRCATADRIADAMRRIAAAARDSVLLALSGGRSEMKCEL